jgi:hypothetical protein
MARLETRIQKLERETPNNVIWARVILKESENEEEAKKRYCEETGDTPDNWIIIRLVSPRDATLKGPHP